MKPIFSTWHVIVVTIGAYALFFVFAMSALTGGNPFVAVFSLLLPVVIIVAPILYINRQVKIITQLSDIYYPEKKVKALKGFLTRNTYKFSLPGNKQLRRYALTLLAAAYLSHGDYAAAYTSCGELQRFLPKNFHKKDKLNSNDVAYYAVLIETLLHLGKFERAESAVKELQGKAFSDVAAVCLSKYIYAYYLFCAEENSAAYEILCQLKPELYTQKEKLKETYYAALLLEARIDKLEDRKNEAFAKFNDIAENSHNYKFNVIARGELEYWTTRF